MAKKQSFAAKMMKERGGETCPTCGDMYAHVQKVVSYYSEDSQSWKFGTQNVKTCKCNEKEVYG